jgi:hypothetical protein
VTFDRSHEELVWKWVGEGFRDSLGLARVGESIEAPSDAGSADGDTSVEAR